jgi:hypothetical protein
MGPHGDLLEPDEVLAVYLAPEVDALCQLPNHSGT